jgi:DNA-binding GntR family transcriptional regulator
MAETARDAAIVEFPQPPAGRAAWLADMLRERLWSGHYRPQEWIREQSLRAEFSLSNGPVREALQLLVSEGLLERVPYCGIRVVALTDREVTELFELRMGLLELAAELAALRGDANALARAPEVKQLVRRDLTGTPQPAPGHLTGWIIASAGNRELAAAWERVAGRARLYVYESARRASDRSAMTANAGALIDAIVAGRAAEARKLVRAMTELQMRDLGIEFPMSKTRPISKTRPNSQTRRKQ